jgi:hypothetical protein
MKAFVQFSPSPTWANKIVAPYKGLPFHDYLRATPPKRPRALTGPIDPAQGSLWHRFQVFAGTELDQQFYEQDQSEFLAKLPLDIRMIIYEMVLGAKVFHLNAPDRRSPILHHHICTRPETIGNPNHQCHELPLHRNSTSDSQDGHAACTALLPLLLSCRRVYSEAIHLLYSSNTFEFTQNFAAFRFLKLVLPPQRLHSIRRFRMRMRVPHHPSINSRSQRDWNDLFRFFAHEMSGLQSLFLVLDPNQPMITQIVTTHDSEGTDWVRPMVLMAIEANRKRTCKVEIVTEGVVHDLKQIFHDTVHDNRDAGSEKVLELACIHVHERIRLSFRERG